MVQLYAKSGDPDQTPGSAASDLGLHCLPMTLLRVSRLQWVKYIRLCDLEISGEIYLNYLQTLETLIRHSILQHLICVCTICQLYFMGVQIKMGQEYCLTKYQAPVTT